MFAFHSIQYILNAYVNMCSQTLNGNSLELKMKRVIRGPNENTGLSLLHTVLKISKPIDTSKRKCMFSSR